MFVDTHCHLDDRKILQDIDELQSGLDGVSVAVTMGCNLESAVECKNLAEKYQGVYFGAGFHPGNLADYNEEAEREMKKLYYHPKCVAVGEIGLDYHWQPFDT